MLYKIIYESMEGTIIMLQVGIVKSGHMTVFDEFQYAVGL